MPPEPTESELENGKKGQSRYVSRCIKYVMDNENPKGGVPYATAKCYGMYKQAKKRKKSKAAINSNPEPEWNDSDFETKLFRILP